MIIELALSYLDIDKLFVVPTYLNPFKKEYFASPKQRLHWISLVTKSYKDVKILDFEIKEGRATPTIKTLRYIKALCNPKKIYIIVGADNLKSLHRWDEYETILELAEFVVVQREEIGIPKSYKVLNLDSNLSSTLFRETKELLSIPLEIRDEVEEIYQKRVYK